MSQDLIVYPIFPLIALTFYIAFKLGRSKFIAVKRGDIGREFFEFNRGEDMPDYMEKYSKNYDNLLSLPILFYVLCGLLYMTELVNIGQVTLAWLFVITRFCHSYVHIKSNSVKLRSRFFIWGVMAIMAMWTLFFAEFVFRGI